MALPFEDWFQHAVGGVIWSFPYISRLLLSKPSVVLLCACCARFSACSLPHGARFSLPLKRKPWISNPYGAPNEWNLQLVSGARTGLPWVVVMLCKRVVWLQLCAAKILPFNSKWFGNLNGWKWLLEQEKGFGKFGLILCDWAVLRRLVRTLDLAFHHQMDQKLEQGKGYGMLALVLCKWVVLRAANHSRNLAFHHGSIATLYKRRVVASLTVYCVVEQYAGNFAAPKILPGYPTSWIWRAA